MRVTPYFFFWYQSWSAVSVTLYTFVLPTEDILLRFFSSAKMGTEFVDLERQLRRKPLKCQSNTFCPLENWKWNVTYGKCNQAILNHFFSERDGAVGSRGTRNVVHWRFNTLSIIRIWGAPRDCTFLLHAFRITWSIQNK